MLKMLSMTNVPVSTEATVGPITVTTGMMALRSACRQRILPCERPFDLAVLM